MLHSLDSPLSVNSSPVAFNDFSKSSIDDVDKYNNLNENPLIYDIDFPHFELYDEMNSILGASAKDEFSTFNNGNQNSSFNLLPQLNLQSTLLLDSRSDFSDYTKENENHCTNDIIIKSDKISPTSIQNKKTDIKKKSSKINKKPIVLRPFVSVWAVEMCVKKLKEFQEGVSSDDQE